MKYVGCRWKKSSWCCTNILHIYKYMTHDTIYACSTPFSALIYMNVLNACVVAHFFQLLNETHVISCISSWCFTCLFFLLSSLAFLFASGLQLPLYVSSTYITKIFFRQNASQNIIIHWQTIQGNHKIINTKKSYICHSQCCLRIDSGFSTLFVCEKHLM